MGQNEVTVGTEEIDIGSLQDEIWDKTRSLFGTGELDLWS